ncbi:MAG: ABC transporter permease [Acidimicrobiales bacterium]|nr:ABC transporter permease [Acidimicrobiales bacterium]
MPAETPIAQLNMAIEPAAADETPAAVKAKGIGVIGWVAAVWLILVVVVAILAPVLPIDDPEAPGAGRALPLFTEGHVLGTDSSQRDVLSRLVWGARASLTVSVGAVAMGMVFGGTLGLVSGYRRGRIDTILSSLFDVMLAFPQLVLALSLVAFLKPTAPQAGAGEVVEAAGGLTTIQILILALGIIAIPLLARITRATSLTWSQREFVTAARAQGAKDLRIMIREVLPNALPAMFSIALLSVGIAIIGEGALSVLGMGVEPPAPSWGNMIAENRSVSRAPLNALFCPVIALFLTVMALNYLGDAIRARFDVRESSL